MTTNDVDSVHALGPDLDGGKAVVRYGPSDFEILSPGSYVRCALTDAMIPLAELKYWCAERQEAYRSAHEGFVRLQNLSSPR